MAKPGKVRVLLIDDETDFSFFVRANLEIQGSFEVHIADNPAEGLKLARTVAPDIILLGIIMPKMDGLELLKCLKDNPKTMAIPVLMLTAKNDAESKRQAARLYNEDFIEKPVELEALQARIEKALQKLGR